MPAQGDTVQEQGFRTSLFGFDKDDVLAYMNTLANEAQQQEEHYREQVRALQAQVDKLQSEQSAARQCVEKLQAELRQAEQRAAQAAQEQAAAEQNAAESQERYKANQQTLLELQFKCRDLQQQLEAAKAPAPAQEPPAPDTTTPAGARMEARRILADARLYAENAEQRLQQQAAEQKDRMAEHARGIAAGVLLLRTRLARVDDKISAATLDLENATAAIYQALDEADTDLDSLGAKLEGFDPDDPVPPTVETTPVGDFTVPIQPARPRITAQPVTPGRRRQVRQPARSGTRLRRAARNARTVSKDLADAIGRFDEE